MEPKIFLQSELVTKYTIFYAYDIFIVANILGEGSCGHSIGHSFVYFTRTSIVEENFVNFFCSYVESE